MVVLTTAFFIIMFIVIVNIGIGPKLLL